MAGRVLRDSKGRFKGSSKGWRAGVSRGRSIAGKARLAAGGPRARAGIVAGLSAGVTVASAAGGRKLILAGARSGNMRLVAAGGALNVASRFAAASTLANGGVALSRKKLAS